MTYKMHMRIGAAYLESTGILIINYEHTLPANIFKLVLPIHNTNKPAVQYRCAKEVPLR